MIRRMQVAIAIAVFALAVGNARAESSMNANYSQAEVKQMLRSANTPQQYRALAAYFRQRQQVFEQQAQSEKQEWDSLRQNTIGNSEKYPRPVDSARNRYEYLSAEADQMGQKAAHFESLSASLAQ